jgi:hypothetical protein
MFNQIIAPGPDGARARSPALGAITRLPSWTPGLALEYANLMAKKQYFRLKVGCGASAIEEDVEEQAEEAVDQGQEHDSPSIPSSAVRRIGAAIGLFAPHPWSWRVWLLATIRLPLVADE